MLRKINLYTTYKDNNRVILPQGQAQDAAARIWRMCEWLYDDFINDATKINSKNLNPMTDPMIFRNDKELDDFCIRSHCRFMSYSVFVCSVDRILEKMYADLNTHFNIAINNEEINKRRNEIEKLKTWRDKVAAHTSYADPKDDNEALQLTSLTQLNQTTWKGSPADFRKMHFGGLAMYVKGQPPSTDLPLIEWQEMHEQVKEHYERWVEMFNKITDNYKDNN